MPLKNREEFLRYQKNYAEVNKERLREYRHQWYLANKSRIRERDSTPAKRELKRKQNAEWLSNNRIKRWLTVAKRRADFCGFGFDIDETDIIIPEICPILGIPLFFSPSIKTDNTPSLDRIDSQLGYIKGNVWIISWKANRVKNNVSLNELIKIGEWASNEISRTGGE